jgi:hypothetical protein
MEVFYAETASQHGLVDEDETLVGRDQDSTVVVVFALHELLKRLVLPENLRKLFDLATRAKLAADIESVQLSLNLVACWQPHPLSCEPG